MAEIPQTELPNLVLKKIFEFLVPLDLNACWRVSRVWREEVNHRAKLLKKIKIKSLEDILNCSTKKGALIQELKLVGPGAVRTDEYDVIDSISRVTLGRLVVRDPLWFVVEDLKDFMENFPNLYHIEYSRFPVFIRHEDFSSLLRHPETTFPSLRVLKILDFCGPLSTILRACPNLKSLSVYQLAEEGEVVQGSRLERINITVLWDIILQQLMAMGLSLTNFKGSFLNPDESEIDGVVALAREFLDSQSSSLKDLSMHLYLGYEPKQDIDLLPSTLGNVTMLELNLGLAPDLNKVLEKTPKLEVLVLASGMAFGPYFRYEDVLLPTRSLFKPIGGFIGHDGVQELRIMHCTIEAREISLMAHGFENLTILQMDTVYHGLLPTIYVELTRLNTLVIQEGRRRQHENENRQGLMDSDFVPEQGPSIKDMKNLAVFSLKCLGWFWNPEVQVQTPTVTPLVTDSLLTNGIFGIVDQLERLSIEGVVFSQGVLEQLNSFMKPHPAKVQDINSHFYLGILGFDKMSKDWD